ncbi:MAG: hypothetical protein R3F17_00535 [Planctomycetota bacterium]
MAQRTTWSTASPSDLHHEVLESVRTTSEARPKPKRVLWALVLGGGVPKSFNAARAGPPRSWDDSEEIRGYLYDIQITSPRLPTDRCRPARPRKPSPGARSTRTSSPVPPSRYEPGLLDGDAAFDQALLDKRARLERLRDELGETTLFERHPEAKGYLREAKGYRLFEHRDRLMQTLLAKIDGAAESLMPQ